MLLKTLRSLFASRATAHPGLHRPTALAHPTSEKFRFVVATRESEADFFEKTAAGKCLRSIGTHAELRLFPSNAAGLPEIYNKTIDEAKDDPAILIFMHDDVHLLDYFWRDCIQGALERFHIVGIVGNTRRVWRQPSWALLQSGTELVWDDFNKLSGAVAHGDSFPPKSVSSYGRSMQEVKLLDGLLFAVRSATLAKYDLRFDARFTFNFYDMDFCRQAESRGLKMGTWPLAVMHESLGNYSSPRWQAECAAYYGKWGE